MGQVFLDILSNKILEYVIKRQLFCKLIKGIVLSVIPKPNNRFIYQDDVVGINPIILEIVSQGLKE